MTDRDIAIDAELDRLRARIAELEAQLATEQEDNDASDEYRSTQMVIMRAAIEAADAELKELRAQLAERSEWTPIEPKTTLHAWDVMGKENMDVIQVSKAFEYADGPRQLLTVSEQFGVNEASVYLPDNIRLCRRVQREDENA